MNAKLTVLILFFSVVLWQSGNADEIDDLISQSKSSESSPLIARNWFTEKPLISNVKLSPNGHYLIFMAKQNQKQQLWVLNNKSNSFKKLFESNILWHVHWAADSNHVFIETETGMASLNIIEMSRPYFLIRLNREKGQQFVQVDESSPQHFFIKMKKSSDTYEIFRVGLDGEKEFVLATDSRLRGFIARAGTDAIFVMKRKGLIDKIYKKINNDFIEVHQCHFTDYCQLLGYQEHTDTLYLKGTGENGLSQLLALNVENKAIRSIHNDPKGMFDLSTVFFDSISGKPVMASYASDFWDNYGFNDRVGKHIDHINKLLNSVDIRIYPNQRSNLWLVIDQNPQASSTQYYLYDLAGKKLVEPLKDLPVSIVLKKNHVEDQDLAIRTAFWYTVSDGMKIHGYLTLPKGKRVSQIPLVVQVHGGPFSRRTGSNTRMAQFLANRGYAVFEPNFRGSTGFGKDYMMSSNKDFGNGRVHQDIIEGLNYILSRGIGDRNRLAITGGSFGGFSTLTALSFNPELFKVGIAIAPAVALSKTATYHGKKLKGKYKSEMLERFGYRIVDINDPIDLKRSYHNSPDYHFHKINKPLYIIAGERDPKVSILNVREFALKVNSLTEGVTFLSAPKEGHIFQKKTAVDAWFYLIEKALSDHLGGAMQSSLNEKTHQFLEKNLVIRPAI